MNDRVDPPSGRYRADEPLTDWQIAARRYQQEFGWPASASGHMVWVVTRQIEALDVPEPLGRRVLTMVNARGVVSSVFAAPYPQGGRLVFLVVRNDHTRWRWSPRLADLGVDHLWAGAVLDLPPSQYDTFRLEWIVPPSLPLPEYSVLAEAILDAAAAESE